MSLQPIGSLPYPPPNRLMPLISVNGSPYRLNASGQQAAWVFDVPQSGSITKLGIQLRTVTTAQPLSIGLYTVDSSLNPTASAYGGMAAASIATPVVGHNEAALATPATATAGDRVALVYSFSGTVGDVTPSAFTHGTGMISLTSMPTGRTYNGTAWSGTNNALSCSVGYSDGSYGDVGSNVATDTPGTTQVFAASSPNEYAVALFVPASCRIAGYWLGLEMHASEAYVVNLYDGTTQLLQQVVAAGEGAGLTTSFIRVHRFPSTYDVAAGKTLHLSISPSSGGQWVGYREAAFPAAAHVLAAGMPQGIGAANRVYQTGSWSATDTTKVPFMGLILSHLSDAAGGGGGFTRLGLNGGFGG